MSNLVKKNTSCNRVCYDKISAGTFPKFEDVTCCDDECITDCSVTDCYKSDSDSECKSSTFCDSTCSQQTLNDKSTKSCCKSCDTGKKCESNKSCCESSTCNPCEPICEATCNKLVKRYNCSKQELLAYSDVITLLSFLKSKLEQVQPNFDNRNFSSYSETENINWVECFVDTLFCVLRKNDTYKVIKVSECKIKNSAEDINRTYLIKVKYCTSKNKVCVTIPLYFRWSQLTNNHAKAFKGVVNYVVTQLAEEISKFQAASTVPFLCC
jgi:hypothetical protein